MQQLELQLRAGIIIWLICTGCHAYAGSAYQGSIGPGQDELAELLLQVLQVRDKLRDMCEVVQEGHEPTGPYWKDPRQHADT